jgi:acetoin utilization deacetylase AcuC-like enzyme
MYWSMHQYPAFPGHGRVDEIGEGRGKGFTINTLLPPGSGDDIFLHALEHYLPIALQFQPDVVAVSAGFDAHQYDLLLDLKVSAYTYYLIGRKLRENFNRLFATLEGGYNVPELKNSVMAFLAGVNGLPSPVAAESTVSGLRVWETYEMYLHSGLNLLKTYWKM